MTWIQLLGAVGIGAIVTKLMDLLWMQRLQEATERRRWLRETRLSAFSRFARCALSLGLPGDAESLTSFDPFKAMSTAAETLLLVDDQDLRRRIFEFIVLLDRLHQHIGSTSPDGNAVYEQAWEQARALMEELSQLTVSGRIGR